MEEFESLSLDKYLRALSQLHLSENDKAMLEENYCFPNHTITCSQMARLFAWQNFSAANLHYGRLGKRVMDALDVYSEVSLDSLVKMQDSDTGVLWILRPQVVKALEHLGIMDSKLKEAFSEEDPVEQTYREGGSVRIEVNVYERSSGAWRRCLEKHGTSCVIRNFDFGMIYGATAAGFIHVHHLKPLSEVNADYVCNPELDLIPVCANCHAVIHMRNPPFLPQEVKAFLKVL